MYACHLDPLLMSARMWESVVIFQSQRVFVSKKVWEKLYWRIWHENDMLFMMYRTLFYLWWKRWYSVTNFLLYWQLSSKCRSCCRTCSITINSGKRRRIVEFSKYKMWSWCSRKWRHVKRLTNKCQFLYWCICVWM